MKITYENAILIYSTNLYDNTCLNIEKNYISKYNRRCINGKITSKNNCVGFCQYEAHTGFLTKDLREKHDCISKGCIHYIAKR